MRHRLIWFGLIVAILNGCSDTSDLSDKTNNEDRVADQPSKQDSKAQSKANPIYRYMEIEPGLIWRRVLA